MDDDKKRVIQFEITKVGRGWLHKACRYALSSVLRNPEAVEPSDDEKGDAAVTAAVHGLTREWRQRVASLRGADWARVADAGWYFAINCPPASVKTKQRRRRCHLHQVCPYCWCSNYVIDICSRLQWVYYGTNTPAATVECPYTGERSRIQPRSLDLIEVVTTYEWPTGARPLPMLFRDAAGIDASGKRYGRAGMIKKIGPIGAAQLFTIEPPDPRAEVPCWRWMQRVVMLVLPGSDLPQKQVDTPDGCLRAFRRMEVHKSIKLDILSSVVGRVCQYPSQMLRGSVDRTVEILQHMNEYKAPGSKAKQGRGFRAAGFYGAMRNKQFREMDAKIPHL